eukprot:gene24463-31858_t
MSELESKKRSTSEVDEEDDDEEEKVETKPETKTKSNKKSKVSKSEAIFDIGGSKKVTVSDFKGTTLVQIREYYTDKVSGEEKPGKKGIALSLGQYNNLKSIIKDIDAALNAE